MHIITLVMASLTELSALIGALYLMPKTTKMIKEYGKDERWCFIDSKANLVALKAILVY
ncbi:hypothetical protein Hs30E_06400 [Lactococcus hodotermopsidis]|uniref:Uncharacterized protein n=1 Tax=Pseudolactococcus hodotermopsidis TaxID=2709157 RepID=A0A6A0B9H3_9LACT|nr:hypothetical protein [Lactococcus hodotermopsidis]GFH42089.1 hypothetical protein Hs30E_06400 [Lactococcus hodotermopsidis]